MLIENYMEAWSSLEFLDAMRAFSPMEGVDFVRISFFLEGLSQEALEGFKVAFREFLLDQSLTFKEKAEIYLDTSWPSGKTFDYLEQCWELIAPDEPCPLEGHPRPEDEPSIRKYTFRPYDN